MQNKTASALLAAVLTVLLPGGSSVLAGAPPAENAKSESAKVDIEKVVLLDIVPAATGVADSALIAVGERGLILRSVDHGASWQRRTAPTSRTLTAAAFSDAQNGVAVGHGGALLVTRDGGESWQSAAEPATSAEDSLLGVTAVGPGHFVAYGAFGLFQESVDGGQRWTRHPVLGADFDRHIYRVVVLTPDRWLLAGESGTLALTEDGGKSWTAVESPYEGSFFGGLRAADGSVLVFGMRGHVFRSGNGGRDWQPATADAAAAFFNGTVLEDGRIALVGNGGLLAVSADNGASFTTMRLAGGRGLAQLAAGHTGQPLIAVGEAGISRLPRLDRGQPRTAFPGKNRNE